MPHSHVNLTQNNENIGFFVDINNRPKRVGPVIVAQEKMTSTYFHGANQQHGTFNIGGTHIKTLNEYYEAHLSKGIVHISEMWSEPILHMKKCLWYTTQNITSCSHLKQLRHLMTLVV